MNRDEIQKALKLMLPAEVDEILLTLKIPQEYLTSPAAPATRAIEIIRYLEPRGRLAELEPYVISASIVSGSHIPNRTATSATAPSASDSGSSLGAIGAHSTANQTHIFVSYSHQDSKWLKRLQVHLKPLSRQGLLELWDDTRIQPGMDWRNEIDQALRRACMAVLLVSADFLASEFIVNNELPPLLDAASRRSVLILPVIVGHSLFLQHESLSKYQAVNPPSKPINTMTQHEADAVLVHLAESIIQHVRL